MPDPEFLGRFRKGEIVPVVVVAQNASDVPTVPDQCPTVIVYSSAGAIGGQEMANVDRYAVTALFFAPVFVGPGYAAGYHRVEAWWMISSAAYTKSWTFQVLAQGHRDGPVQALGVIEFPAVSYVLGQTRLGRVKKFKNPRAL